MSKHSSPSLFEMSDFRTYVRSWAKARGRGEFRRIALTLGVHTTLISQIFNNKKCLTMEQAALLCSYMGLNRFETEYFLKLVQIERAGSFALKSILIEQLKQLQQLAEEVRNQVPSSTKLSEQDRAIFYSSWQYALVRLLTSLPNFQTREKIAHRLFLSISRVQEILDFLATRGLIKEEKGRYRRTGKNTHVEASSSLSIRHHQNWRAKVIELQENLTLEDLVFTAPLSIARKDIPRIRKKLLETISEISHIVEKSPNEEIHYRGIDWIKL